MRGPDRQVHPSRPISRILSPLRLSPEWRRPSIWDARYRTPPAAYPGLQGSEQLPVPGPKAWISPLLGLALGGVCLAGTVTSPAGGLLHHHFTLANVRAPHAHTPRYAFCGTMPSGRPAWPLASTVLYRVRTFLTPHATRTHGAQSPGRLGCTYSISDRPQTVKQSILTYIHAI
jgi:hypothetical protein